MNSEEQREIMSYLILEQMFLEMVGICVTIFIAISYSTLWWYENHSLRQQPIAREGFRRGFLDSLINQNDQTCVDQLRMNIRSFRLLCVLIRNDGRLKEGGLVSIEE